MQNVGRHEFAHVLGLAHPSGENGQEDVTDHLQPGDHDVGVSTYDRAEVGHLYGDLPAPTIPETVVTDGTWTTVTYTFPITIDVPWIILDFDITEDGDVEMVETSGFNAIIVGEIRFDDTIELDSDGPDDITLENPTRDLYDPQPLDPDDPDAQRQLRIRFKKSRGTRTRNLSYGGDTFISVTGPGVIPEPATMALLAMGALALVRRRRR